MEAQDLLKKKAFLFFVLNLHTYDVPQCLVRT